MSPRILTLVIGSIALGASLVAWLLAPLGSPEALATAASPEPSEPLTCRFVEDDTAAFAFESSATLDEGSVTGDHVQGVLSWIVVEEASEDRPALLRASLRSVLVDQALSEERVRAGELEDGPFYLRVDSSCRFTDLGFSPRWSIASRRLVTTLLQSYEVVLAGEGAARWQAEQRDGVGEYTAHYAMHTERGLVRVRRAKPRYRLDDAAARMGVRVQLLGAEAEARFDPEHPAWALEVTGRERVRFHIPGEEPQGFVHRFSIAREDGRYVAVSDALALADADFTGALEADANAPSATPDPALRAIDHEAARERFLAYFRDGGRDGVFPAARFLAAWLRAHPDESGLLLADLRSGTIDEVAHAALFLALELAGTGESRQVLADAIIDSELSELNRARAAAALADHGVPTRESAELLLTQARESGSPMVANVSLLGAGRMAGRTDPSDPLRAELRDALHEELARARGEPAESAILDAIGNSGDDAFGPALDERLRADRPALRAHAAEALGHLSPEVARPLLLAGLETEASPSVRTAIVRSLSRSQAPEVDLTPAELTLAARLLATSESADTRTAVIDWLGRAAHQREARGVLAAHFHAEPSVHLKQRIGAFVTPAELRELAG